MHYMLVIPGMLTRDPTLLEALRPLQLPALQRLLARGRGSAAPWEGLDHWLLERFAGDADELLPSAPFALLGEGDGSSGIGIAPQDHCWVHADPVHLHADRDQLLLADAGTLAVRADEAEAIAASFNRHFAGILALHIAAPGRWYASVVAPPNGTTVPLDQVAGRHIEPGRGGMGWHALMNEMQMLLHEHPVNEAREAKGEPLINGVWLWGAGRLTAVSAPFRSVASMRPLALGLAKHAGIAAQVLPRHASEWLAASSGAGMHLLVYEAMQQATREGDPAKWLQALRLVEEKWLAPLIAALQSGSIGMLTLHLGGARSVISIEAARQDLRRFWRRTGTLASSLAAADDDEGTAS